MYHLEFFRDKIQDIARPYHFRCAFNGGCFGNLDAENVTASIRTSALPGITINPVDINYFGMIYKLAGTPIFDPLTATFIIDSEYEVLSQWKDVLDQVYEYQNGTGPVWGAPQTYMGTMKLDQLNTERSPASTWTLKLAFLSGISAISYSQDNKDTPLTFDATITYSYYVKE